MRMSKTELAVDDERAADHADEVDIGGAGRIGATVYVHLLCHHGAQSMLQHGALGAYSCEAMEANNSSERFVVQNHCNFKKPALDAMTAERSNQLLGKTKRPKRRYTRTVASDPPL
jgi:hypothetical protein